MLSCSQSEDWQSGMDIGGLILVGKIHILEFEFLREEATLALTPALTPVGFCIVLQKKVSVRTLCEFCRRQFQSFR